MIPARAVIATTQSDGATPLHPAPNTDNAELTQ